MTFEQLMETEVGLQDFITWWAVAPLPLVEEACDLFGLRVSVYASVYVLWRLTVSVQRAQYPFERMRQADSQVRSCA